MTDNARTETHREPAAAPTTPGTAANPATVASTAYGVRIVAGVLLIVVFGGLPTVVDGPPLWAAVLGLVGVIVGAVLVGLSVNAMIRERRNRSRARRT